MRVQIVKISRYALAAHKSNVHEDSKIPKKIKKQCHICGKRFNSHHYWEEHILVKHQQKTPYKCDKCHRSYGTNMALRKHMACLTKIENGKK